MILADFSNLIISAAFAQQKDTIDEGLLRHMFINTLLAAKTAGKGKYGDLVLAYDDKNYWRKDVSPFYKAHRAKAKEASSFDWEHFYKVMDSIKIEIATVFPYRCIQIPRAEADDIIGHLALTAKEPTLIYANDHDFFQCQRNPNVHLYRPLTKKWVKETPLPDVEWNLFVHTVKGDSGDGVPSIRNPIDCIMNGVKQLPISEKNMEEWYASGRVPEQYKARYEQNKQMVDLRLIPQDMKDQIEEAIKKPPVGSQGKIFQYMTSKGLNKLASAFIGYICSF